MAARARSKTSGPPLKRSCTVCLKRRPLYKFWPQKRGLYGRSSQCSECKNKYRRKLLIKNPEYAAKQKENALEWQKKNKVRVNSRHALWRKENRDKVRKYQTKYRNKRPDIYRDANKRFRNSLKKRGSIIKFDAKYNSRRRYGEFWEAHRVFLELQRKLKKEGLV